MGEIDARNFRVALRQWEKFLGQTHEVKEISRLLSIAVDLPEKYGLRSLDAFQLAAALVWCKEKPKNRPFICADSRLGDTANDAGFDVIKLA